MFRNSSVSRFWWFRISGSQLRLTSNWYQEWLIDCTENGRLFCHSLITLFFFFKKQHCTNWQSKNDYKHFLYFLTIKLKFCTFCKNDVLLLTRAVLCYYSFYFKSTELKCDVNVRGKWWNGVYRIHVSVYFISFTMMRRP